MFMYYLRAVPRFNLTLRRARPLSHGELRRAVSGSSLGTGAPQMPYKAISTQIPPRALTRTLQIDGNNLARTLYTRTPAPGTQGHKYTRGWKGATAPLMIIDTSRIQCRSHATCNSSVSLSAGRRNVPPIGPNRLNPKLLWTSTLMSIALTATHIKG